MNKLILITAFALSILSVTAAPSPAAVYDVSTQSLEPKNSSALYELHSDRDSPTEPYTTAPHSERSSSPIRIRII